MRFLDLVELSAAILRRKTPLIRGVAYEGANQLAVAEVDEVQVDHFVDDAGQFEARSPALKLSLPTGDAEVVGNLLENGGKNDRAFTRVLYLLQPSDSFARDQPIGSTRVFLAASVERLGLLFRPYAALAQKLS